MANYLEKIESTPIFRKLEATVTTGDIEYPGTALEISTLQNEELFEFVVDSAGVINFLVHPYPRSYRITLDLLERIVGRAKEAVQFMPDPSEQK